MNYNELLLLGLPFGVTRLCSIGRRHGRADNIFDVLYPGRHEVDKLYNSKPWAFFAWIPLP